MRGIKGLAGWQWLFIVSRSPTTSGYSPDTLQIEGILTIAAGFVFLSLFPKSPGNPVTIFGYRYFSERESQILQRRVTLDDPTKAEPRRTVSWAELKQTASLPPLITKRPSNNPSSSQTGNSFRTSS